MDLDGWPPPRPAVGDGGYSWLTALGFSFLTFNSGMAVYRSQGDPWSIAFVVFSYIDLVLFFYLMRMYERGVGPGSSRIGRVKVAVWMLTALLTIMISYKVAVIMPLPEALLIWLMAGTAVAGGFYAFFVHPENA